MKGSQNTRMTNESLNELHFRAVRVNLSSDIRNNFVSLPSSIVQTLESTGIAVQEFGIAISVNGIDVLHVGWNGYESQGYLNGQSVIDINPILAKEVDLVSGVPVDLTVSVYDQTRTAKEVFVEPMTSDDWEIIESHAMFFQDEILHQTRIMTSGEVLICYVDNVVSRFRIKKVIPETLQSARIDTGSLIVIAPRENLARVQKSQVHNERKRLSLQGKAANTIHSSVKRTLLSPNDQKSHGMKVFLNCGEVKCKYAFISILQNSIETKHSAKQEKSLKFASRIAVEVECASDCRALPPAHIQMTSLVWETLCQSPQNGNRICVDFFNDESSLPNSHDIKVILRPTMTEKEYLRRVEHQEVSQHGGDETAPEEIVNFMKSLNQAVLTNRMVFFDKHLMIEIFDDRSGKHLPFIKFSEQSISWKFTSPDVIKLALPLSQGSNEEDFIQEALNAEILEGEAIAEKLCNFSAMPSTPSNCVVIEGSSGMGKTTILKEIAKKLILEQGKYVKYVDCDSLLESSNFGKMKQLLHEWCSICYWHHPSVLLMDNADSLFSNAKSEDPQQQAMLQRGGSSFTRVALFLINLVEEISRKNSNAIKIIMTTSNKNSLNTAFFDKHFVHEVVKRKALNIEERSKMIEFFFKNDYGSLRVSSNLELRDIALETEGYSPIDLKNLTGKLFYEASLNESQDTDNLSVSKELFTETIKSFTPSSLRGVKLTKGTGVSWKDIGALKGPKRLLLETLEWPTKYAPIFKNCPLQLRSGILLYGYPGCGKTLLASAVAQQCGLNFITVKGPEILNKYIGASEQNIRELFEKAQSVKPCVLFFDEFDSIAPKRGHDSTGVTDRVVNQLLTQMDGVEGLDGVYVLAATSRPDLIDSALLRPGRIDKSVLCTIPDKNDRLDILKAVTSSGKMSIDENANLVLLAERTDGYSGADLQGLCYNAYLKSIHRHALTLEDQQTHARSEEPLATHEDPYGIEYTVVNDRTYGDKGATLPQILRCIENQTLNTDSGLMSEGGVELEEPAHDKTDAKVVVKITSDDLLAACEETKPSISTNEFYKLQSIYNTFQQDRDGNMPSVDNPNDVGTRSSLM